MKNFRYFFLGLGVLSASGLVGCASTVKDTYVKNINTDKAGNLVVEKCDMEVDRWKSTIDTTNCRTEHMALKKAKHRKSFA